MSVNKYKILAISDNHILKQYSIEQINLMFKNIDFIVSCGDVSYEYLDYVVSILNKEMLYVNGNHVYGNNSKLCGGRNIDGKLIKFKNMRVLGLDGSRVYSYAKHQYSEKDMKYRVAKLIPKLIFGVDLVISHSPPRGIHDKEDPVHKGFKVFNDIIRLSSPKLWLHGHIHLTNHNEKQESIVGQTKIVNVYGYKIIDIEV